MKWLVYLLAVVIAVLHQDFWNWSKINLVFGILPIGLAYHAGFAIACSTLMFLLVKTAWPTHLEHVERDPSTPSENQEIH